MSNDRQRWANRRINKGAPDTIPVAAAPALAAPPPGYAWAAHPQHGYVLVALAPQMPQAYAPPMPPPVRQPDGVTPYFPQSYAAPNQAPPGRVLNFPPQVRTCELVKPGNRDTYAELLERLPELPVAADPNGVTELQTLPEYREAMLNAEQYPSAYPAHGKGSVLAKTSQHLGSVALPPAPSPEPGAV